MQGPNVHFGLRSVCFALNVGIFLFLYFLNNQYVFTISFTSFSNKATQSNVWTYIFDLSLSIQIHKKFRKESSQLIIKIAPRLSNNYVVKPPNSTEVSIYIVLHTFIKHIWYIHTTESDLNMVYDGFCESA